MKTFLILDGNSLLHRAWHAIPPLTTKDGRVVNAAYGFTMVIEKIRDEFKPDYLAVAWDLPGGTFRHEAYAEYKGTREKKADELYEQIDLIKEILDIYHVPSLSLAGFEADDVIATISEKFGKKDTRVLVLTGDLDTLQLVDDNTHVITFVKGLSQTREYDVAAVRERYNLNPGQLTDFKALMGDPSDNIPGIAGVGKKTASDLLSQHGTIEGIYDAIEAGNVPEKFVKKFIGQEKEVEKMKHLVQLILDVDLGDFKKSDAKMRTPDVEALKDMFRDLEFKRLLQKYESSGEPERIMRAPSSHKKTDEPVVHLSELKQKELTVYIEHGQADLFGGGLKSVVLFDGRRVAKIDDPSEGDLEAVRDVLSGAQRVLGHDLKAVMHHIGFVESTFFDTMVAAYLLSPGGRAFDLASCAYEHIDFQLDPSKSSIINTKIITRLAQKLKKVLSKEGMIKLAEGMEMPLMSILYQMEKEGIFVDQKKLTELSREFGEELDRLTSKIYKLSGREFNINSPSQLAEILFDELKLPTKKIKKTKTGFSTAASELEKLWEKHDLVPLIGEYREFAKLKSTYVDALPKLIADDGRIHTTYNQTVAATGRLSSSDPNLQNIPIRTSLGNEIRKAFIAPKGRVLIAADYSQFELRLATVFAKDKSFTEAFQQGADIHRRTAAEVLGVEESNVTKAQRSAAKAINFGILYGMGSRNLARSTGFSQQEAKVFLETYFALHPGIAQYIEVTKEKAHSDGYVETLFGRRRYLPDINSGIRMLSAAAERMAVNMPVQGTQADLLKMAMINVSEWIEKSHLDVKMLLQVHDELVFEAAEDDMDKVVREIQSIMEAVHQFEIPLVVNVEVGKNWGMLKEWKR
jgi:DNA polymerase I